MGKKNPDEVTSHDRYHAKVNMFIKLAIQLINMIVGYDIESSSKEKWIGMIKSANEAIELLKNREFAVKLLNSFCADKVDESPTNFVSPNENGEALQKEKEELQSFGQELLQIMDILEQKQQSIEGLMVYTRVAKFLQIVTNSCSNIAAYYLANSDCASQVEGHHGVERQCEKLTLKFPETSGFNQNNQKGKNVKVHDNEMVDQVNQMILTLRSEGGRLAELNLEKMGSHLLDSTDENSFWDFPLEELGIYCDKCRMNIIPVKDTNGDEGTSNAAANKANVKLSPEETSKFEGVEVFKRNFDVLNEIQREYRDTFETFKLEHLLAKSTILNLLAEVCQNIRNEVMLEQKDIEIIKLLVQAMEHSGLKLTWLGDMLENVHRKLMLQERIQRCRTLLKEDEMELARLEKKPRFQ